MCLRPKVPGHTVAPSRRRGPTQKENARLAEACQLVSRARCWRHGQSHLGVELRLSKSTTNFVQPLSRPLSSGCGCVHLREVLRGHQYNLKCQVALLHVSAAWLRLENVLIIDRKRGTRDKVCAKPSSKA